MFKSSSFKICKVFRDTIITLLLGNVNEVCKQASNASYFVVHSILEPKQGHDPAHAGKKKKTHTRNLAVHIIKSTGWCQLLGRLPGVSSLVMHEEHFRTREDSVHTPLLFSAIFKYLSHLRHYDDFLIRSCLMNPKQAWRRKRNWMSESLI